MRFIGSILFLSLLISSAGSVVATESQCEDGIADRGDLGIGYLLCVGGGCRVNVDHPDGARSHWFSVEPSVWDLTPGSPAAQSLQAGDQIVAIDGALITSTEGGRRLASLEPGVPVQLLIRRDRREAFVVLTPERGCGAPALRVRSHGHPSTPPWRPTVEFGMDLICGECGWRRDQDGAYVFETRLLPTLAAVEPGGPAARAGFRVGDVLLRVDGRYFAGPDAASHLGALRPGDRVVFDVLREGLEHRLEIRARTSSGDR